MPEINQLIRRKGLFWLTVMEVPVHIHLALLFWACGIMAEQSQEQKKK
jgi:hypothetical protein